jgi:hypothetical protein
MVLDVVSRRKGTGKYPNGHFCKCGNKIVKYSAKQCLKCYRNEVVKPKPKCLHCGKPIRKYTKNKLCYSCFIESISKRRKPTIQYDMEGNIIKKWKSIYEVIKYNPEWESQPIIKASRGERKSAYGFIWKYIVI